MGPEAPTSWSFAANTRWGAPSAVMSLNGVTPVSSTRWGRYGTFTCAAKETMTPARSIAEGMGGRRRDRVHAAWKQANTQSGRSSGAV